MPCITHRGAATALKLQRHRGPLLSGVLLAGLLLPHLCATAFGSTGKAAENPPRAGADAGVHRSADVASALDRPWSVGTYAAAWRGAYSGYGTGVVLRWRFWPDTLSIEVFGSAANVDWPDSERKDYIGGFAVTMPFRLHRRLSAQIGAGFCGMISRIEPLFWGGPRNDAVLLGVNANAGVQWAASGWVSLFVQSRAFVYAGADRKLSGETTQGQLALLPSLQVDAGLSFHFGG